MCVLKIIAVAFLVTIIILLEMLLECVARETNLHYACLRLTVKLSLFFRCQAFGMATKTRPNNMAIRVVVICDVNDSSPHLKNIRKVF